MDAAWLRRRRTHLWVVLLLLPALASRLLVAPGFMPGTGAGDSPTMQMCHGAGPLPAGRDAPAPQSGDPGKSGGSTQVHTSCVFAATGASAPPPVVLPPLAGPGAPESLATPPLPQVVRASEHHPYSPRGPPLRAVTA
jgi:hypothetical protein